jgi:hypothetical protein
LIYFSDSLFVSTNIEGLTIIISSIPGHGKFESLGALGISSMLLVTAGGIAWHSFEVLQVYYFPFTRSCKIYAFK